MHLVKIASLDQPLGLAVRPGDHTLYIAEKVGRVVAIRGGRVDPVPVLDLSGSVSQGSEQGLLGLTFSPDGRFLYVNFTDLSGDTNVVEYEMGPRRADLGSARRVLLVHQPFANHNGGDLAFGPDGDLYVGLGDGGSEGDPLGNGQNLGRLLGKMLRIDPRPSGAHRPYGIPADNPFVGKSGVRPEIWAYGLRNPWRFSFDRTTGDLWIGDVGQDRLEEIDFQPAGSGGGRNYGWNRMEGTLAFRGSPPPGAARPIFEYPHEHGACAVTGGYVYRGADIPHLGGAYVFADFCTGQIMALVQRHGKAVEHRPLGVTVPQLASFGQDAGGELYVLSLSGSVFKLGP